MPRKLDASVDTRNDGRLPLSLVSTIIYRKKRTPIGTLRVHESAVNSASAVRFITNTALERSVSLIHLRGFGCAWVSLARHGLSAWGAGLLLLMRGQASHWWFSKLRSAGSRSSGCSSGRDAQAAAHGL